MPVVFSGVNDQLVAGRDGTMDSWVHLNSDFGYIQQEKFGMCIA